MLPPNYDPAVEGNFEKRALSPNQSFSTLQPSSSSPGSTAWSTTTANIGGYIMSGLGAGTQTQSAATPTNSLPISAWTSSSDIAKQSSGFLSPSNPTPSESWKSPYVNNSAGFATSPHPIRDWIHQTLVEYPEIQPDPNNVNDDFVSYFESIKPLYSLSTNFTAPQSGGHNMNRKRGIGLEKRGILSDILVPDTTKRVFHPQQRGYILMANLVLYHMAVTNAKILNEPAAVEYAADAGTSCPLPAPACGVRTSNWGSRDPFESAAATYCSDNRHLKAYTGSNQPVIYNDGTLDAVELSITWSRVGTIGEGQCNQWFDTLLDTCDLAPTAGNTQDVEYGGSVDFADIASFTVLPLTVRKPFSKGQTGTVQCNTLTNTYVDQSTLLNNIEDFCFRIVTQNNSVAPGHVYNFGYQVDMVYNFGTQDYLSFVINWPISKFSYVIFPDECAWYFTLLVNDCSTLPASNNPLNWRSGGKIIDTNDIWYSIKPYAIRPPAPTTPQGYCITKLVGIFLARSFEIWGAGWSNSDFGESEGGLLKQLQGCGIVTFWSFVYSGGVIENGLEWRATGYLPSTIKSGCVERAIASAGGFTGTCG